MLVFATGGESCTRFNGSYGINSKLLYGKSSDASVFIQLKVEETIENGTEFYSSYNIHLSLQESSGEYTTVFKTIVPIDSPDNIVSNTYFSNLFEARDEYLLTTNETLIENCTISFSITENYGKFFLFYIYISDTNL